MPCSGTAPSSNRPEPGPEDRRPTRASERERRPREGADDGADSVARGQSPRPTAVSTMPLSHPAYPIKCHPSTQRTQAPNGIIRSQPEQPDLDQLENTIGSELPLCRGPPGLGAYPLLPPKVFHHALSAVTSSTAAATRSGSNPSDLRSPKSVFRIASTCARVSSVISSPAKA